MEKYAKQYEIPLPLARRMVAQESGGDPDAVSKMGARGVMQLMPDTALALGVKDPHDPVQNIEAGMRYLRQQYDRFGRWDLALAAYNAGPDSVARYKGIPPYQETQNYVRNIMRMSSFSSGQRRSLPIITGEPKEPARTAGAPAPAAAVATSAAPVSGLAKVLQAIYPAVSYPTRLQERLAAPGTSGFLSGGPISDVFDLLRTGEYAVGGILSGKGTMQGIRERVASGPQFAMLFHRLGAPDNFATDAAAFLSSMVADPLNLVGTGLVGKGLRLAGLGGVAERAGQVGPTVARGFSALAEHIGEKVPAVGAAMRSAAARRSLEPILERSIIAENAGIENAIGLGKQIRQDAGVIARAAGQPATGHRLDEALGLYFDAGADTMLNQIAQSQKVQQAAATATQRTAAGRVRGAAGQAARAAAESVRKTAAQVVAELRGATQSAVTDLKGLSTGAQQDVLFRASQAAADAATRGLTARQAEQAVAKAISGRLRELGVAGEIEQQLLARFRLAIAPLTKERTAETAASIASGVRQRVRSAEEAAEAGRRAAEAVSPAVLDAARQAGLRAQEAWLQVLAPTERAFVEKWAPIVTRMDTDAAENLVRVGMMRPETAAKWQGLHLRRIYQKFEDPQAYVEALERTDPASAAELLGKIERGIPIRKTGSPIPTGLAKPRELLEEATRTKLGELREASSRLVAGNTLAARAIARGEAFTKIAEQFGIADNLIRANPLAHEAFRRMPDTIGWGRLAGRWLPKEIADTLLSAAKNPEGVEKAITYLTGQWKFNKVILNPATHGRNIRTNIMLIHNAVGLGGLNPKTWVRAWREVATNGPAFREAKSVSSAFIDTFTNSEIRRFIGRGADSRGLIRRVWGQLVADPMARAYNFEEQLGKMVVYLTGRGRGLSPEASALLAEKTLFNYRKVPPTIDKARRWGIYPFITFPYKVATETIPSVVKRPGRFAQQARLVAAGSSTPSPEEQRVLPSYMRTGAYMRLNPLLTRFPIFNDARSRPVYYDLSYELVFGDLGEMGTPIGQILAMTRGDASAWQGLAPLLTPIGQLVSEIILNRSLFTGEDIRRRGETESHALTWHALRTILPGGLYAIAETAANKLGLRPEPTSQLARTLTGTETRLGKEPLGPLPALAATFAGMRTVPVDVQIEGKARALELKRALEDARSELASVAANPNFRVQPGMPPEEAQRRQALRAQKIREIQARIQQLIEEYKRQGYVVP